MLRDRLVCGINDYVIQYRLLGEATLSFTKAMEIAQGMESAALHAKDIQKASDKLQSDVFHVTETVKVKTVECYRCGGAHYANACKFKETVCHICGKKGHLAKKLRGTKSKLKNTKDGGKPHAKTHHIGEAEQEETSYSMFNLSETRSDPLYATVQVNGASLKMEIDTWASASIISEETYGKLWSNERTQALCESPIKLRTYTGESIPISGAVNVNIAYGNQTAEAHLLVVKGTGPSLLGRDWLSKIKLNWGEIRLIKRLCAEDVVARYPDVFKDELDTLRYTAVKLCVEPNAVPRFFKWSVPFGQGQGQGFFICHIIVIQGIIRSEM